MAKKQQKSKKTSRSRQKSKAAAPPPKAKIPDNAPPARTSPGAVLVCAFLCTILASMGVRYYLLQISGGVDAFTLSGEKLFSSLDSHFWLAGAEGFGRAADHSFAQVLDLMHDITGISHTDIAFWSPVLLACLPLFCLSLVLYRTGYPEAAIVSGVFGVNAPIYLVRTAASRFDTDSLAVLGPIGLIAGIILILYPYVKQPGKTGAEEPFSLKGSLLRFAGILLLGYWCKLYLDVYPQGQPILLLISAFAVLSSFLWLESTYIQTFTVSLVISLIIANVPFVSGLVVLMLGGGLICVYGLFQSRQFLITGVLGVLAIIWAVFADVNRLFFQYAANIKSLIFNVQGHHYVSSDGLSMPSIFTSISESSQVGFNDLLHQILFHPALFGLSTLILLLLIYRHRILLLFVPLLGLALAGKYLGLRFALYGPPVCVLSLGLGFAVLFRRFRTRSTLLAQLGIALLIIPLTFLEFSGKKLEPVLDPHAVQALRTLQTTIPENSELWTWWDLGYPAQYYARKHTFADGGWGMEQRKVIPLASVYMSNSAATARKIMSYAGAGGIAWKNIQQGEYTTFVQWIQEQPEKIRSTSVPRYLVLTLDFLKKTKWMSYYAGWNFQASRSTPESVHYFGGEVDVLTEGILRTATDRFPINEIMYFDASGRLRHKIFGNISGNYAVAVEGSGTYVFQKELYESLLVQMLMSDPERFRPYFDLVLEDSPFIRVYEVRQSLGKK